MGGGGKKHLGETQGYTRTPTSSERSSKKGTCECVSAAAEQSHATDVACFESFSRPTTGLRPHFEYEISYIINIYTQQFTGSCLMRSLGDQAENT